MRKSFEFLQKYAMLRFYAVLILVGIIFTFFGGMALVSSVGNEICTAEAVITSITEDGFFDGDIHYRVLVTYTDKFGERHKDIDLNAYSSGMEAGDTVTVEYDPETPEIISKEGGRFIPVIIVALGVAALVFGAVSVSKALKNSKKTPSSEEDAAKFAEDSAAVYVDNGEEIKEYYYHFTGRLNQSYILETPERVPIYKANCDKVGIIKKNEFTFENCLTGTSKKSLISHTVTTRYGASNGGFGYSVPTNSAFKIDGEDCWTYLERHGYGIDVKISGIKLNFDLIRLGTKVGYAEAAGVNVARDDKQYKLGNVLPAPGVYKVYCRESDIEGAFMACFIASRVEFY